MPLISNPHRFLFDTSLPVDNVVVLNDAVVIITVSRRMSNISVVDHTAVVMYRVETLKTCRQQRYHIPGLADHNTSNYNDSVTDDEHDILDPFVISCNTSNALPLKGRLPEPSPSLCISVLLHFIRVHLRANGSLIS